MTSIVTFYEVGGAVRDSLLGLKSKDIDFAVEAESYEAMRRYLIDHGFNIFVETPAFLTIRAHFPAGWDRGMPTYLDYKRLTADFVLCRSEGAYSDGRRPDEVTPGTILDDLARRDFTVNAIAKDPEGNLIDPHNGVADIERRLLRCVGSAEERIREDALRALRAIRFCITKDFYCDPELEAALKSDWLPPLLASVSRERKREELVRCFRRNTTQTLWWLWFLPAEFSHAIFDGVLWLRPTLEE